jgi:hypothetical protein
MVVPLETARRLAPASDTRDHRVIRIRFEGRASLLDAFALAQKESWIEDCHVILPRLELVIRMAGGFSIECGRHSAQRRTGRGTLSLTG